MKLTNIPKFTRVVIIYKGVGYTKSNVEYENKVPSDRRCLVIYDSHPSQIDIKRLTFVAETIHTPDLENIMGSLSIEDFASLCIKSFCNADLRVEF